MIRQTVPVVLNIGKEIDVINNLDRLDFDKTYPIYRCAFIFPDEPFTDTLFGSEIIALEKSNRLIFEYAGLQFEDIKMSDIFVRAGQWASHVKRKLNVSGLHKKFTDANTYSKTLKLGFRLQSEEKDKRVICYVNLLGCLESVQNTLIESNINISPSIIVKNPDKESLDVHLNFQRLNRIFHKVLRMKSILDKARSDIRYFKYDRGCVDNVDIERQATDVDLKLQILLEYLKEV